MLLYYHEEDGIANIYNKTIGYIIFLDGRIPTEYCPEAYYLAPTCSNPIFCDVIIIMCIADFTIKVSKSGTFTRSIACASRKHKLFYFSCLKDGIVHLAPDAMNRSMYRRVAWTSKSPTKMETSSNCGMVGSVHIPFWSSAG